MLYSKTIKRIISARGRINTITQTAQSKSTTKHPININCDILKRLKTISAQGSISTISKLVKLKAW